MKGYNLNISFYIKIKYKNTVISVIAMFLYRTIDYLAKERYLL